MGILLDDGGAQLSHLVDQDLGRKGVGRFSNSQRQLSLQNQYVRPACCVCGVLAVAGTLRQEKSRL